MKTASHPETHVVGIATRTTNALEADPKKARIGALWKRFFVEGLGAKVPGARPGKIYGVYTDYASDHRGEYTLLVGSAVPVLPRELPAGMVARTIPARDYDVFTAQGVMPKALIETWGEVWKHYDGKARVRAFTTDFEVHEAATPDEVRVHVAT